MAVTVLQNGASANANGSTADVSDATHGVVIVESNEAFDATVYLEGRITDGNWAFVAGGEQHIIRGVGNYPISLGGYDEFRARIANYRSGVITVTLSTEEGSAGGGGGGTVDQGASGADPWWVYDDGVGTTTDAAASAGGTGSLSAKLRLLTTQNNFSKNAGATDSTTQRFVLVNDQTIPVSMAAGSVGGLGDLIDITLSLDTSAYASGDVLADTQVINNAVRVTGGRAYLQSLVLVDEDDQKQAMTLLFFSANRSLGSENSAPNISDANARDFLGSVAIATGDYLDLGGVSVVSIRSIGLMLEAASGSTDLYVGAITGGTPTHTASGLRLRLGFSWD